MRWEIRTRRAEDGWQWSVYDRNGCIRAKGCDSFKTGREADEDARRVLKAIWVEEFDTFWRFLLVTIVPLLVGVWIGSW
ncbi:MAG: hypothetical protein OXC11_00740 [Rhodospirillales bacterium]|nr:hypothetical protein [Rhodospirillales bacterium]